MFGIPIPRRFSSRRPDIMNINLRTTRVMRAAVPIPAVADASVSHSAAFGGSVVGVVGLLLTFGEFNN